MATLYPKEYKKYPMQQNEYQALFSDFVKDDTFSKLEIKFDKPVGGGSYGTVYSFLHPQTYCVKIIDPLRIVLEHKGGYIKYLNDNNTFTDEMLNEFESIVSKQDISQAVKSIEDSYDKMLDNLKDIQVLNSNNIVTIHKAFKAINKSMSFNHRVYYVVMSFLNQNLPTYMKLFDLKFNDIYTILLDIAYGLKDLKTVEKENTKLQLGDLKPDNIVFDRKTKKFRLIDLDTLRFRKIVTTSTKSQSRQQYTEGYVAPEVVSGNSSDKADIYSLGKIGCWLFLQYNNIEMTQENCWEIRNMQFVFSDFYLNNIVDLYGNSKDISYAWETCPKEFKNLLWKCINPDSNKRPDVEEIIGTLKGLKRRNVVPNKKAEPSKNNPPSKPKSTGNNTGSQNGRHTKVAPPAPPTPGTPTPTSSKTSFSKVLMTIVLVLMIIGIVYFFLLQFNILTVPITLTSFKSLVHELYSYIYFKV